MDLNKASWMAKQLMKEHGIGDWGFRFAKSVNNLGFCSYGRREIALSVSHTALGSEERVRNTILHEIAHALVGPHHDHDNTWRSKALEIGCDGQRCSTVKPEERVEKRYIIVCSVHGTVGQKSMHVRGARPKSCGRCSPTFNPAFMLQTKLNPAYHTQRESIAAQRVA